MYHECKIKYEKITENGLTKKVTESYIVDAVNFGDAEKRITEEMTPYITGEFDVCAIKRTRFAEISPCENADGGKWYSCKLDFIVLDDKSGKEKKYSSTMLVESSDLEAAKQRLTLLMAAGMQDYEIKKIAETGIMDVYI